MATITDLLSAQNIDVDLQINPPELVASLWKGAGAATRITTLNNHTPLIVKVIKSAAALTSVQLESYRVEHNFYTQGFAQTCQDAGLVVPTCCICDEYKTEDLISTSTSKKKKKKRKIKNSKTGKSKNHTDCPVLGNQPRFYSVLSDLTTTHPTQVEDCNLLQAKAALSWMANFHAIFTNKVTATSPPTSSSSTSSSTSLQRDHSGNLRGLWRQGTFWTLTRNKDKHMLMCKTYDAEIKSRLCKEHDASVLTPSVLQLGQRLNIAAKVIHQRLQPEYSRNKICWFTLLHGDLKGANIKFTQDNLNAGVYDFQWAGGGLNCQDIAYFMISAVHPSALIHEEELLQEYFIQYKSFLSLKKFKKKMPSSQLMTFSEFHMLYEIALLDFMRWLIGYGLWGGPAESWSLQKADEILSRIDRGCVVSEEIYEKGFEKGFA